ETGCAVRDMSRRSRPRLTITAPPHAPRLLQSLAHQLLRTKNRADAFDRHAVRFLLSTLTEACSGSPGFSEGARTDDQARRRDRRGLGGRRPRRLRGPAPPAPAPGPGRRYLRGRGGGSIAPRPEGRGRRTDRLFELR